MKIGTERLWAALAVSLAFACAASPRDSFSPTSQPVKAGPDARVLRFEVDCDECRVVVEVGDQLGSERVRGPWSYGVAVDSRPRKLSLTVIPVRGDVVVNLARIRVDNVIEAEHRDLSGRGRGRTVEIETHLFGRPTLEDPAPPEIVAGNVFLYYSDVEAAWDFYTGTIGLETAADYGFAKILRASPTSYVTLVDAERGMHGADEPKTVTVAFVTEEVEGWYDYLSGLDVPMRAELTVREGSAHDGFVAIDPEGYFLEFERFNPHTENRDLLPRLAEVDALRAPSGGSQRPPDLGIQATVLWLYYADLERARRFYADALGSDVIVDQGWAKVFGASPTGFVGLVDGARGLHQATEEKGVTVSFFTEDVDGWFDWMEERDGFRLRTPEITDESGRVRVFVGYDPEGYFLEWDTFLDAPENDRLLEQLGVRR